MAELSEPAKSAVKKAVMSLTQALEYRHILNGVGPFNGGCLVTALAIQEVFGGELWALRREDGPMSKPLNPDQHIVVGFGDDWFVDGFGGKDRAGTLEEWAHKDLVELVPTTANYAKRSCDWTVAWGNDLEPIAVVAELSRMLQDCISDGYFFRQNLERSGFALHGALEGIDFFGVPQT
jgi:hypothetical protein